MTDLVVLLFFLSILTICFVKWFQIVPGFFFLWFYFLLQNVKSQSSIDIFQDLLSLQADILTLNLREYLIHFLFLLIDHVSNDLFGTTVGEKWHGDFKRYDQKLLASVFGYFWNKLLLANGKKSVEGVVLSHFCKHDPKLMTIFFGEDQKARGQIVDQNLKEDGIIEGNGNASVFFEIISRN